ncbi:hypothetical protein BH24BAC1_BH24BAC1_37930 [soil metagenome]
MRASASETPPQSTVEKIAWDATTAHLAAEDFPDREELAFFRTTKGKPSRKEKIKWLQSTLSYLRQHRYFTEYAQVKWNAGKETNLAVLQDLLIRLNQSSPGRDLQKEQEKKTDIALKSKEQRTTKGIQTLFRTTMASHLQLSAMADTKANLMISINAIVASIILSTVVRHFGEMPHLVLPTLLLIGVCILTFIFAVLATNPTIKPAVVNKKEKKSDLLFFGEFIEVPKEKYRDSFKEMLRDDELLYDSRIDNIYAQGVVLTRKYWLVKIAYTVFLFGFTCALISFALAFYSVY